MNRPPHHHRSFSSRLEMWLLLIPLLGILCIPVARAEEPHDPEATLRTLVRANAERDLATMSQYMSHDVDAIGYTIDGRKYVGWPDLASDMRSEFESVVKLEIPITDLRMWSNGAVAWFAMELDYIRYSNSKDLSQRMVLPLRETGVLEQRNGRWILVAWHESTRHHDSGSVQRAADPSALLHRASDSQPAVTNGIDLSGEWEIQEVKDGVVEKTYRATLGPQGNGPYTWQGGQISTTSFVDRRWQGTWKQTGNDREGAFEVVVSENGTEARGIWWYVRVGTRNNIPPRQHGGDYVWKRLTPPPAAP